MSRFDLRPARPTDAGQVGAILSAFIDQTAWMPRIHTRAEDLAFAGMMIERGWVTLAEMGGEIAGFAARDGSFVHALYVATAAQGQGCGSAMLTGMQSEENRLTLWTFQANDRARAFYSHHGFDEVERTDGAGNDEGLPDIRMEWRKDRT